MRQVANTPGELLVVAHLLHLWRVLKPLVIKVAVRRQLKLPAIACPELHSLILGQTRCADHLEHYDFARQPVGAAGPMLFPLWDFG